MKEVPRKEPKIHNKDVEGQHHRLTNHRRLADEALSYAPPSIHAAYIANGVAEERIPNVNAAITDRNTEMGTLQNLQQSPITINTNGEFEYEGQHYVLSRSHTKALTILNGTPWCAVYNPNTHVVAYKLANGKVSGVKTFMKESFAVEPYEKHETIHFLKAAYPEMGVNHHADYDAARKAFMEAADAADVEALVARLTNGTPAPIASIKLDVPVRVTGEFHLIRESASQRRYHADTFLKSVCPQLVWDKKSSLQFRVGCIIGGTFGVQASELMDSLANVKSWVGFRDIVVKLKPFVDEMTYIDIKKDASKLMSEILDVEMGLGVMTDDFLRDFDEIMSYVAKNGGDNVMEAFERRAAMAAAQFADTADIVANCDDGTSTELGYYSYQHEEVALLNVYAADIQLTYEGRAGVVTPSGHPEFYAFLKGVLDNGSIEFPARNYRVVTLDGAAFKIYRSAYNRDTLLVSTAFN